MADPQVSNGKIATNIEDAMALMAERVAIDGDDWRVKIMRRASMAAPQEVVAILDGATSAQLLSPESWLTKLAGGSAFYSFRVVHEKDRGSDRPTAIYMLPAIPGTPLSPNPKMVGSPGWAGPASIEYPTEDVVPRNGATKWPAAPDPSRERHASPAPSADGGGGPSQSMLAELARERERLADERHRMEMDAVRREAEADRKRFEAKLNDLMAEVRSSREAAVAAPKADPMETIVKVAAAFSAALTPILPIIVSGRETAAKAEESRLAREEKRDDARQARENALMEKLASAGQEQAKVIGVFTESLSTVARSMVQTVAMVGELRQPEPQDDGIMGVLKAGIAAWAESQSRSGGSFFPTPALPPQPPPRAVAPPAAAPSSPPAQPVEAAMGESPDVEEREVTPTEMLDILSGEIRERSPEEDLANGIVEALAAQDFVEALVAEGGVLLAIQKRLGEAWANDQANVAYLQRLFTRVGTLAAQKRIDVRPLFPPQS